MGYEVDFLPVPEDEGERSGDAITLRYGNLNGSRREQRVVVIDGGFRYTGPSVIEHIREYYATNEVDLIISTHPDADHLNGLHIVLEEMQVNELWMHKPSERRETLDRITRSISDEDQRNAFREAIKSASELEDEALANRVDVREPFLGRRTDDGALTVVGPSEAFYNEILHQTEAEAQRGVLRRIRAAVEEMVRTVRETWFEESLTDEGKTSPTNNTSVATLFSWEDHSVLFTADAGIPALTEVASVLESNGLAYGEIRYIQVPHHGSKRNVGPTILDRVLGSVKDRDQRTGIAIVSASPDGEPKHPAKKVLNAFRRRGYPVWGTLGSTTRISQDAPPRPGFGPADPFPFYNQVEE